MFTQGSGPNLGQSYGQGLGLFRVETNRTVKWKETLPDDHVMVIMLGEHDYLLKILEKLQLMNQEIQAQKDWESINYEGLLKIVNALLDTESHHLREENVLFPRLEKYGQQTSSRIMQLEHKQLRECKKQFQEFVEAKSHLRFREFQQQLDAIIEYLLTTLREHIYKEDTVIYPLLLESIPEEEWESIKQECDRIGYSDLTLL